jgi:pimeloyl-ACP methyl ester carboxylesterase
MAAGPPALVHRTQCPEMPNAADPRPLVWVVDGAGDLRGCSNAVTQANLLAGTPVEVVNFNWSHGHRRLLMDQIDAGHAREQGKRLAALVRERQAREPGRRVVLVSHSAGCAVTLAAADYFPADSIDRVVMFAPSVSVGYDLRPTLRAAREGVDVFCSKKDWVALGLVTRVVGTTDRFGAAAAGRNGFRAATVSAADVPQLRQHFWTDDVAWTGHNGGHPGMYSPTFLHQYLFPLVGVSVR